MKVSQIIAILVFSVALAVPGRAPAQEEAQTVTASPGDFAGQLTLSGVEGDVMWLELPSAVYEHVERTDLGDIRVFDATGLPVPFEIRKPERVSVTPNPVGLSFFPWQAEQDENLPGRTDIQIDSSGAVIKVNNQAAEGAKSSTYLIDMGGLQYNPSSLKLAFRDLNEDFNSPAEIRYSNDLAGWQLFDKKQTVARFGVDEKTEHFSLQVPKNGPRYLLLQLGKTAPELAAIEASFDSQSRPGELRGSVFSGEKSEDGMEVSYNTGGYYPIVSINFILPKPDTMSVDVKNRMTEKAPWAFKSEGDIYRFKADADGDERKNKPFEISSRAPYWLLHSSGPVPFVNVPEMEVQWEPYKVVWLARGEGPWVLAYGNRDYAMVFDNNLSSVQDSEMVAAGVIGEEKYEPRPVPEEEPESDYQQWILWAVLIIAVLVLSGLAYVVAKGMNKKQE